MVNGFCNAGLSNIADVDSRAFLPLMRLRRDPDCDRRRDYDRESGAVFGATSGRNYPQLVCITVADNAYHNAPASLLRRKGARAGKALALSGKFQFGAAIQQAAACGKAAPNLWTLNK
jgi:hypothetical protein